MMMLVEFSAVTNDVELGQRIEEHLERFHKKDQLVAVMDIRVGDVFQFYIESNLMLVEILRRHFIPGQLPGTPAKVRFIVGRCGMTKIVATDSVSNGEVQGNG